LGVFRSLLGTVASGARRVELGQLRNALEQNLIGARVAEADLMKREDYVLTSIRNKSVIVTGTKGIGNGAMRWYRRLALRWSCLSS